jgi:hypothetical protein
VPGESWRLPNDDDVLGTGIYWSNRDKDNTDESADREHSSSSFRTGSSRRVVVGTSPRLYCYVVLQTAATVRTCSLVYPSGYLSLDMVGHKTSKQESLPVAPPTNCSSHQRLVVSRTMQHKHTHTAPPLLAPRRDGLAHARRAQGWRYLQRKTRLD